MQSIEYHGNSFVSVNPECMTPPFSTLRDSSMSLIKSAQIKAFPQESLQSFGLKPRFEKEKLQLLANEDLYFESLLYNCTKMHVEMLGGRPLKLASLGQFHPICAAKRLEVYLSVEEIGKLNERLEDTIERNPWGHTEYKLVCSLMELVTGLLVHLGLYHVSKYRYRQHQRVLHVHTLDLIGMNAHIQSMETLWIATQANQPGPLTSLLSEPTKQLAKVLVSVTESLFAFALRLNSIDFRLQPDIDGYLLTKEPNLGEFIRKTPRWTGNPPVYQELSFPTSLIARCLKSRTHRNLEKLRALLSDQDVAFRTFEESMLANFLL